MQKATIAWEAQKAEARAFNAMARAKRATKKAVAAATVRRHTADTANDGINFEVRRVIGQLAAPGSPTY